MNSLQKFLFVFLHVFGEAMMNLNRNRVTAKGSTLDFLRLV